MMFAAMAASTLFFWGLLGLATAQNVPTTSFLSRPDINAPGMKVETLNEQLVGEGYIFLTPSDAAITNFTYGMYMYTSNGSLVWDGTAFNAPGHQITDFYACSNYNAAPHLCVTMFSGPIGGGTGAGSYSLIIDNSYTQAQRISPSYVYNGAQLTMDLHEFNVVGDGSSALLSSYAVIAYNATFPACNGSPSVAYIKNGLFTETSTDGQNTTIFAWNALDHVDPTDTYICPFDNMVGGGTGPQDGFDFFHINAIDKDDAGDYLVSSRHLWTLFKVAGLNSTSGQPAGSILWRLGGKNSSFTQLTTVENSGAFNFSYQHHARWKPGGVHFWDNANNDITPPSAQSSSGMGVNIDTGNMSATLVAQVAPPSPALDSSQGSHQILPNGNHFCGLGSIPEIYERTTDGTLVFDAYFGVPPIQSYRAFRYPWTAAPNPSQIALFTYAPFCGGNNAYHVSWNGATEVATYNFFVSNASAGPFVQTASVVKDFHFESTAVGAGFGYYGYAEALDEQGAVLARTRTVETWVPSEQLAPSCDATQCPPGTNYSNAPKATCQS